MTPPEPNEARARMLFAACGFAVAALAAVAVLLALGLRDRAPSGIVVAPARPAPARASASAVRDQARRTAARRSSALAAEIPKGQLFAPTSVWNERVPSNTSPDPSSGVLVAALVAEVQREHAESIGPW